MEVGRERGRDNYTCSHTYYNYLRNYYWEHPTIVCNVRVLIK